MLGLGGGSSDVCNNQIVELCILWKYTYVKISSKHISKTPYVFRIFDLALKIVQIENVPSPLRVKYKNIDDQEQNGGAKFLHKCPFK